MIQGWAWFATPMRVTSWRNELHANASLKCRWRRNSMAGSLAVVNIGQLVTLAGPARPRVGAELRELGLVENAALLVEDGRITSTGPYSQLRSHIPAGATIVDAQGCCVTPGFVDAHTHLVFAGNRAAEFEQRIAGATYQEIAAAGGGILSTVALTRAATEDELLAAARRHRDWMLRSGTTTIEAKSGYGLERETELRMLRVMARLNAEGPARIVSTLLAAHMIPPEFEVRREEYIRWIEEELIPEVSAAKLAACCDAFCDDHALTVNEARRVLTAARRHGLRLRIHAGPFPPGKGGPRGPLTGPLHPPIIWRPCPAKLLPCCAMLLCSRCCSRAQSLR